MSEAFAWDPTRGVLTVSSGSAGSLLFAGQIFFAFPCQEDLVCFHMWRFNRRSPADYIAVAATGLFKTRLDRSSECHLNITDQTDQTVKICRNGQQGPFAEKGEDTIQIPDNLNSAVSYTRSLFCDAP